MDRQHSMCLFLARVSRGKAHATRSGETCIRSTHHFAASTAFAGPHLAAKYSRPIADGQKWLTQKREPTFFPIRGR